VRRAIAILIGLAALLLAACGGGGGGGGSGSSSDAQQLVKETFNASKPLNSGKLQVTATVVPHGLQTDPGTIKLSFAGPFDRGNGTSDVPKFNFTLGATLAGQTYSAGATSTGTSGFLSLQGDSYALPASEYASLKKSFTQLQSVTQPKTTQGQLDWLSDPQVKGDASVAGATTTHMAGSIDMGKLLSSLQKSQGSSSSTQQLTDAQISAVNDAIKNPTFDFYTGKDDHLLRRVTLAFTLTIPESQQSQVAGLSSADVTLDYQVGDLNQPQTITAPSNPKPITQLAPKIQALQQLLSQLSSGSLGSGTGSGSSGSSGSSGGASPGVSQQAQKYAQCIQAAANDVAKQQKCAALLR
jgi:hypothetical protein